MLNSLNCQYFRLDNSFDERTLLDGKVNRYQPSSPAIGWNTQVAVCNNKLTSVNKESDICCSFPCTPQPVSYDKKKLRKKYFLEGG